MVRSTTQFDPVANPQAALDRRNLVITQMQEQGMIDQTQAQQALAEPLGIVDPLGTRKNGCIGAGDAGFFCKYVTDYLAEAGIPMDQILRGGYTIKTTLDRNAMEKMKASLNAEVPADAAERRERDGDRRARPGQAPGAGDGVEPDVRAGRRASRRPATGCPTSR